jgi:hypothetical protein
MLGDWGSDFSKLWPWRDLAVLSAQVDRERVVSLAQATGLSWVLREHLEALPVPMQPTELIAQLPVDGISLPDRARRSTLTSAVLRKHWIPACAVRLTTPRALGMCAQVLLDQVPSAVRTPWRTPADIPSR